MRSCEPEEEIAAAGESDTPALLEIADATYGRGARTAEIFRERFAKGMKAYVLRKAQRSASYFWVAERGYEIYPLRLRLEVPEGGRYFFDEATAPDYRRQGMLGKLMRFAWTADSLRMAAICVVADNQASLAANCRIGFRPVGTVSMTQFLLMRFHSVQEPQKVAVRRFLSRPRLGTNRVILNCRLDPGGRVDFGWAPAAPLATRALPATECDLT